MRTRPVPLCNKVHTTVVETEHEIYVYYHSTKIVKINRRDGSVVLDSGGHRTATTKRRMNQASEEFGLGFHISQQNGEWFVSRNGDELPFHDLMHLYKGVKV